MKRAPWVVTTAVALVIGCGPAAVALEAAGAPPARTLHQSPAAAVDGGPSAVTAGGDSLPRNVILMISDGCGPAEITLARMFRGRPLSLDSILTGAVETSSADSRVTDSAAGATAYASGVRTFNRVLGLDRRFHTVPTLLEGARARGFATGLVVKSELTDATPAAFYAHVSNRSAQDTIAAEALEQRVDLLVGGGRSWFEPTSQDGARTDGRDLLAEARRRGYQVVLDAQAFRGPLRLPLLAPLARRSLHYAIDHDPEHEPDLPEMTRRSLALLAADRQPFFVMIEGSLIDDAGHANDPAAIVREVLEYDHAVREALAFARRDGHTLVVSTSDHECGGLGLGLRLDGRSPYLCFPESLATVSLSARRMADSVRAAPDPERALLRLTGYPALRDDEKARLAQAVGSRRRLGRLIAEIESLRAHVGWTSGGHTGVDVGLYAFGPGSDHLRGALRNDEVGRILGALLQVPVGR